MPRKVTPFLMFEGRAEEAMIFYAATISGAEVKSITRYGPEGPGKAGSVYQALMSIAGQDAMFIDSPVHHAFAFTPSISFFIDCEDEAEFDRLYAALSEGGETMMPPNDYGFSKKFAWTADRFGVSWQINLP